MEFMLAMIHEDGGYEQVPEKPVTFKDAWNAAIQLMLDRPSVSRVHISRGANTGLGAYVFFSSFSGKGRSE